MGRYILFVQCAPKPERDEEFNRWLDEQHIADICAIPGVSSARRLESIEAGWATPPLPYATIYELETDAPEEVLAAIRTGAADGSIPVSDALDGPSSKLWLFKDR